VATRWDQQGALFVADNAILAPHAADCLRNPASRGWAVLVVRRHGRNLALFLTARHHVRSAGDHSRKLALRTGGLLEPPDSRPEITSMFRFTIRDVLWLTVPKRKTAGEPAIDLARSAGGRQVIGSCNAQRYNAARASIASPNGRQPSTLGGNVNQSQNCGARKATAQTPTHD